MIVRYLLFAACIFVAVADYPFNNGGGEEPWVKTGVNGKLVYRKTAKGDSVMDFSTAGYGGGGVPFPDTSSLTVVNVSPRGNGLDDTETIQDAIDTIARVSLNSKGLRGVVQLSAGNFSIFGQIVIEQGGIILQGSGNRSTVLLGAGSTPHQLMNIAGSSSFTGSSGPFGILGSYIPVGSRNLTLNISVAPLDAYVNRGVWISVPYTAAWIKFMQMDTLVRDGVNQTWLTPGMYNFERNIVATDRATNSVLLDAPIPINIDSQFYDYNATPWQQTPYLRRGNERARITQIKVANLAVIFPADPSLGYGGENWLFMNVENAANVLVENIYVQDATNGVITVEKTVRWMTAQDIEVFHTVTNAAVTTGYPFDFFWTGNQVLLQNVYVHAPAGVRRWWVLSTSSQGFGPIVFRNITIENAGTVQPHQRWTVGVLFDNVRNTGALGGVELLNRLTAGTGHGWAIGWGVVWNGNANNYIVTDAPCCKNFLIGGVGEVKPDAGTTANYSGTYYSVDTPVLPQSLYIAQLNERLASLDTSTTTAASTTTATTGGGSTTTATTGGGSTTTKAETTTTIGDTTTGKKPDVSTTGSKLPSSNAFVNLPSCLYLLVLFVLHLFL